MLERVVPLSGSASARWRSPPFTSRIRSSALSRLRRTSAVAFWRALSISGGPRRDRDRRRPRRSSACSARCTRCGAATACRGGCSSTTAARSCSPTGLGEVVRVLPAPGRHAGVHPAPRAVAQRHDRALQRHLRQALLPPGALHRPSSTSTERAGAFERFHNAQHRYSATARPGARRDAPPRASRAPRCRSPSSPPAGPSAARSSSSASSAPTTSCGCSAARSRCPTAPPTSTSPPRSTSPCADEHNLLDQQRPGRAAHHRPRCRSPGR